MLRYNQSLDCHDMLQPKLDDLETRYNQITNFCRPYIRKQWFNQPKRSAIIFSQPKHGRTEH